MGLLSNATFIKTKACWLLIFNPLNVQFLLEIQQTSLILPCLAHLSDGKLKEILGIMEETTIITAVVILAVTLYFSEYISDLSFLKSIYLTVKLFSMRQGPTFKNKSKKLKFPSISHLKEYINNHMAWSAH